MTDMVKTMRTWQSSVEANMGQAGRWASVALSGLVAASLCVAASGPARAASAGPEVLGWNVTGTVEGGGIYSFGERGSSRFNEYRDMDNGFIGDLSLRGEKKDSPYYFDLRTKNPARDDQLYEGEFGRYGLFRLDLGWDRTPHVLSNSARTIFQERDGDFTLPSGQLRTDIRTNITSGVASTARTTINDLLRPVDLSFNTDVGRAGFKLTPTEALSFDLEYSNLRREGRRPLGTVIGSPGGSPVELAIPVDNMTHEVKFGAEFAREAYGLQFSYIGSIFRNNFDNYSWDNPSVITDTATASSRGQIAAPPDNLAHTFSLTGTAALPLRSRVSGTFSYGILRQDEAFLNNIPNTAAGITQRNTDDAGNGSADAKANLILGNIQLTSRPINSVTATARYRYFEYQNDSAFHSFTFAYPEGIGPASVRTTTQERFTKQNAGFDLGWRPIRVISLKTGYEYEHWNRGDREANSTSEHIGKVAADFTPVDWFLGRVTYSYGDRTVEDYQYSGRAAEATGQLPQLRKFDEADRRRNKLDILAQFTWDTVSLSPTFAFALDDYYNSDYGLKKADYYAPGISLGWNPLGWLTLSADYSYEYYKYNQQSRYRPVVGSVVSPDTANNDWVSKSKDEFHNVGLNAVVDLLPKKFDVTLGYTVSFGYTTIRTSNPTSPPTSPATATSSNASAFDWDKVFNVLQTVKVVARYRLTERLQVRLGYAYERYTERDFARDPMQPFMGDYERATPTAASAPSPALQAVYLGATQPNYEANVFSFLARYDF